MFLFSDNVFEWFSFRIPFEQIPVLPFFFFWGGQVSPLFLKHSGLVFQHPECHNLTCRFSPEAFAGLRMTDLEKERETNGQFIEKNSRKKKQENPYFLSNLG